MLSKEAFIEKWRNHIAGLALYGTISDLRDSPMTRATRHMQIPALVEKTLGQMYESIQRAEVRKEVVK